MSNLEGLYDKFLDFFFIFVTLPRIILYFIKGPSSDKATHDPFDY